MTKKQAQQLIKLLSDLREHLASSYENDADTIEIDNIQQLTIETFNLNTF